MRPLAPALALILFTSCTDRPVDETSGTSTTLAESTTDPATTTPTSAASEPATTTTGAESTTTADPGTSTPASTTSTTTGDLPLECPPAIDEAIAACIVDLQADPEQAGALLIDLLLACSDAEPVADDYDAHCASAPDDPICALDYRTFVADILPLCVARVQDQLFADVCLLPALYADLLFTPSIALMQRRALTDDVDLTDAEQQQLVFASQDMGLAVDSAADALLATDDGTVEQQTVLDVGTDRAITIYTGRYGGVQRGRALFRGTHTIVGAVEDGLLLRCAVERGVEGQPCADDGPCAPDHTCNDILKDGDTVLFPGACIKPGTLPGEGDPCTAHDECGPAGGLLCLDAMNEGDPGTCRPGWMRRTFAGPVTPLTPGGSAIVDILVAGVATVPTAAYLDLTLTQADINDLELELLNPDGTANPVAMTSASGLLLHLEQIPVPGDESAGGKWQLIIKDVGGQAEGTVSDIGLTLDTRWD
jgi:hypothetical protein